jgi:glycerol-3-phosphate acyltransferase PlsY
VFVGDAAKGALAAGFGRVLAASDWASSGAVAGAAGQHWWLGYVGGFAAMVGHAWPVFDRFRGGRSVLCFVGAACVVSPLTALAAAALAAGVWAITRSFAWGARVGVFAFPLVQLVVDGPVRTAATGVLMCLVGLRFWQAARGGPRQPPRDTDQPAVLGG